MWPSLTPSYVPSVHRISSVCVTLKSLAVLLHLLVTVSILSKRINYTDIAKALAQEGEAQSTVVHDPETGISYSSYTDATTGMTFGVALPKNVTDPYDAILRISAPIANQWVGFAWGGDMVWNPLSVAWPNGNSSVISARFALYVLAIRSNVRC